MIIVNFIKSVFTKEFWAKEFNDIPSNECFNCNKGTCEGCRIVE